MQFLTDGKMCEQLFIKGRRNGCRSAQEQECGREGLPEAGNSFGFFTVAGLCILSLPDIWEAPNEAYITAT